MLLYFLDGIESSLNAELTLEKYVVGISSTPFNATCTQLDLL
jgi:hypothetical protein